MSDERSEARPTLPAGDRPPPEPGAWWRLPLLLVIVLAAIVAARSFRVRALAPNSTAAPRPPAAPAATGNSVSLTIRLDDGTQRSFDDVAWHRNMTVDDLLAAVSQRPDTVSYAVVGEREMMLVTQIDDAANDKATGRFWTYSVNGKLADRSLGIYELQPGDRVLWTFGTQR